MLVLLRDQRNLSHRQLQQSRFCLATAHRSGFYLPFDCGILHSLRFDGFKPLAKHLFPLRCVVVCYCGRLASGYAQPFGLVCHLCCFSIAFYDNMGFTIRVSRADYVGFGRMDLLRCRFFIVCDDEASSDSEDIWLSRSVPRLRCHCWYLYRILQSRSRAILYQASARARL